MGSEGVLVWPNPHTNLDVSASTFFSLLEAGDIESEEEVEREHVYWNTDLTSLKPRCLFDTQDVRDFIWESSHYQLNLWAGRDVITHLHFDSYVNFYFQIVGKKEFLLCPPNRSQDLAPYPFLHPSYSHSQWIWRDEASFRERLRQIGCLSALLRPGDLLYVPPYYYHHVISYDVSVSVNTWSHTHESDAFQKFVNEVAEILSQMVDVERCGSSRAVVGWMIRHLRDTLCDAKGDLFCDEEYFSNLVRVRYDTFCENRDISAALCSSPPTFACPATEDVSLVRMECADMEHALTNAEGLLFSIHSDEAPFWISNYLEMISLDGNSGDVRETIWFLRECV